MTWFKVDDGLAFHQKAVAAGNPAMGLWVRAGAWAAHHLTDGHIPAHMAGVIGTPDEVAALVAVGFWDEVDGGYRFHDWGGFQPSSEAVKAERAAAKERQQRARERAREAAAASRRDNAVTHAEVQAPSRSPRPDPTRPDQKELVPAPQKRRGASKPLPDDWTPTDDHAARATATGLNLDREVLRFRNHAQSHDRRLVNWNAAFTNWLDKATDQQPRRDRPVDTFWKRNLARSDQP